ncbi:MAG: FMN-binding protein [Thermodesulfobacteriota bacterium]|nr:FMN-binding protein [Thermodesulfobacteriota bacterium]
MKNNYIVQAWLVLILAIFYGGALAGIQLTLAPKIAENRIQETRERVPGLVLGADQAGEVTLSINSSNIVVEKNGRKVFYQVFKATKNGEIAGWVAKHKGQGYADKIELLIGLNPGLSKITGLYVLNQKETPGLGNKIIEADWRKQFINAPTSRNLEVVKTGADDPNEIDAITGATISSRSVCSIVNTALNDLKSPLHKRITHTEN